MVRIRRCRVNLYQSPTETVICGGGTDRGKESNRPSGSAS
jgi:hypothetical protein